MQVYKLKDPVLRRTYVILRGTRKDVAKYLKKQGVKKKYRPAKGEKGNFHDPSFKVAYIWLRHPAHISHECIHAVMWAFNTLGIPISHENDEFFAYYHDYLVREVRKCFTSSSPSERSASF